MYILVKRNSIRFIFLGFVLILTIPVYLGKLTGLSLWFSPFLMLNSFFVLKSIVALYIISFIILIIVWFRKRWFCNYLCPVGLILGKVPQQRFKIPGFSLPKMPDLNIWISVVSLTGALVGLPIFIILDPLLIFNGFFLFIYHPLQPYLIILGIGLPIIVLMQLLFPDLWCERLCPLGGLQILIAKTRSLFSRNSSREEKFDLGRRIFIGGAFGMLAAFVIPKVTDLNNEIEIRPPGAIDKFNSLCIRCGSCIRVCPTQILTQNSQIGFGLLTPVVEFRGSYCLETCNACSIVCPSGSISSFKIDEKKKLKMGQIEVEEETCLLMKFRECGICKPACTYKAIDIVENGKNSIQMMPVVKHSGCTGCGACIAVCPENCFRIVPLTRET
jgi:ferredoxin-type protein NapF